MDEFEPNFCTACGAQLPGDVSFCPKCGASLNGTAPAQAHVAPAQRPASGPTATFPIILTGFYAVIAILSGVTLAFNAEALVAALKEAFISSGIDWTEFLASVGFTSDAQFVSYMFNNGVITLVSGLLVAVSCGLCAMARYNLVAVASCVLGSLVLLAVVAVTPSMMVASSLVSTLFMVAIGSLVAYLIYRAQDAFQD